MVDALLDRTNVWLEVNSLSRGDTDLWEAAAAILTTATLEELADALQEVLAAAKTSDEDARDVVATFSRLHPPQSLSNPERQRSLVGNYLVLRQQGFRRVGHG